MTLARARDFFIPSEANNYRAKALHHTSLAHFGLIFLIFQLMVSTLVVLKPQVLGFASQISPARIVELTNQERAKVGAPALSLNSLLSESAQRKAGDMFAFSYWSHNSPSGRAPWDFFKEVGYFFSVAGENLARDFSSPEAVVSAWMASPTHRDNLLNPKYREIGISVVDGDLSGMETTLVVQHLATPVAATSLEPTGPVVSEKVTSAASTQEIPSLAEKEAPLPEPEEVSQETQPGVALPVATGSLVQATGKEKPLFNPFVLTQDLGAILVGGLLLVVVIDGILIWQKKVFRLTGHGFAHGVFLFGVLIMIILSSQGAIL